MVSKKESASLIVLSIIIFVLFFSIPVETPVVMEDRKWGYYYDYCAPRWVTETIHLDPHTKQVTWYEIYCSI